VRADVAWRGSPGSQKLWLAEIRGLAPRLLQTFGSSLAVVAFSVVSGVVLARGLGPTGRGELALLLLWPQLLSTLGNLGLDLGATYFSADRLRSAHIPAAVIRLALRQSLVVVPVYLALWPLVFRGAGLGLYPLLMALLIPVDLVAIVVTACLNGRHDYGAFNTVRSSMAPVYAVAVGVLLLAGGLTVGRAAAAYLAANTLLAAFGVALLRRRHGLGSFDASLAREVRRFGLRGHLGRLSPQGLGIDVVIVALVLSRHDLGLFTVAIAFLGGVRLLSTSAALVVYPHVSSAHLGGAPQKVRSTIVLTVCAAAASALVLWFLAGPLVTGFFGARFSGAAHVLRLLALGEIARTAYLLLIEALRGLGHPGLTTIAESANWLVFLAAVTLGAAAGGLIGLAFAIALASFLSLGLLLVISWRSDALTPIFGRQAVVAVS
jgi:O-antigen/teichoic acid export membrane protein